MFLMKITYNTLWNKEIDYHPQYSQSHSLKI